VIFWRETLNFYPKYDAQKYFLNILIKLFLFHQGNVVIQNINVDLKMTIATFPAGMYLTVLRIYDGIDDNILTLKIAGEIISRDRREFK